MNWKKWRWFSFMLIGWLGLAYIGTLIGSEQDVDDWGIQKLDYRMIFANDREAWLHVYDLAEAGSFLHQQALSFIAQHAPREYTTIIKTCLEARPPKYDNLSVGATAVHTNAPSHPDISDTPVPGCYSVKFEQPNSDRILTVHTRTSFLARSQTLAVCWVQENHPGKGWRFIYRTLNQE